MRLQLFSLRKGKKAAHSRLCIAAGALAPAALMVPASGNAGRVGHRARVLGNVRLC